MDVISLHECGVENAAAVMGTAVTRQQLEKASLCARRGVIILLLDADEAGRTAMKQTCTLVRATSSPSFLSPSRFFAFSLSLYLSRTHTFSQVMPPPLYLHLSPIPFLSHAHSPTHPIILAASGFHLGLERSSAAIRHLVAVCIRVA